MFQNNLKLPLCAAQFLGQGTSCKSIALNFGLLIFSIAVTLLAVEAGMRINVYLSDNEVLLQNLEDEQARSASQEDFGKPISFSLGRNIRLSVHQEIIYEWQPNRKMVDAQGNEYTINNSGFRGPYYQPQKGPLTVRIVGLGDSVMFGFGVSDNETYMHLLTKYLNTEMDELKWEIINTAVPGYNTVMELETLSAKGLQYKPDIVIMNFVGNDLSLPNFIREREDVFKFNDWYLVNLFRTSKQRLRSERLKKVPDDKRDLWMTREAPEVPRQFRKLVGITPFRNALKKLSELQKANGFELLVVQLWPFEHVIRACDELGLPLITLRPFINKFLSERGFRKWLGSPLSLSEADPHPSSAGHRLIADVLVDHLNNSGLLDRTKAKFVKDRKPEIRRTGSP